MIELACIGRDVFPVWVLAGIVALGFAVLAMADETAGWLNVRDCGASGSEFSTTASAEAGSNKITVKDIGDFKVGQGVMVSKCNVRYEDAKLWGPRQQYAKNRPLGEDVQFRGYDGSAGSWVAYILDVDGANPPTFRWTDDFGTTWQGAKTPIDDQWHALSGKTEVRFGKLDWDSGYSVSFRARDQLVSTIEKIEGNVLTLRDAANRTVSDAVVRHTDAAALQAAVDRAVKEKRNVFIPVGHYLLSGSVVVKDGDGITIEGENAVHTVMDISEGEGPCIRLQGGAEVTLRNLSFLGHTGFDRRAQCGSMRTMGGTALWGFYFKLCNAMSVSNTERVLVENCHARKMSAECFYSAGRSRSGKNEPKQYTKAITYLRCSVEDCGRNAFNNNDMAENTSVLYCRVVDVGGCTWEGASRFVKFIGNYVRNGGTVAMGNIGSRIAHFEELGSGQHIVADNVFETGACYGGAMVRTCHGATQVVIRDNLFINFGTSAIDVSGLGDARHLPSRNATVSGNIIDMTEIGETSKPRIAIDVSGTDTIVSDNQIYVRGKPDAGVTAIKVKEPAINVAVHDNLIRNCGGGIVTERSLSPVAEVIDAQTFVPGPGRVPMERRLSPLYRGWNLAWVAGSAPNTLSTIESFDAETLRFKLTQPREMKAGDRFEVFPVSANWNFHNNTITSCLRPVALDSYGGETSLLRDNLISRGDAAGVKQAVEVHGAFKLIGNCISGFDEEGASALALHPDAIGRVCRSLYRGNIFQRCANVVSESQKGLWEASATEDNLFIDCGSAPDKARHGIEEKRK